MKKILVLGAGFVSGPLVRYLLDRPDFHVTCADLFVSKAIRLIDGHERGEAKRLDLTDPGALAELVPSADLVVSFVPYVLHVQVAELCIKHRKHMVTASYVSVPMKALDAKAREAGVVILNEIGMDPGIDHMSAMRVFSDVKNRGGRIDEFMSYCGGLPAPDANDNPFGYKFSWSPKGVLLAGRSSARYRKDGRDVEIPSEDLFEDRWTLDIQGEGEGYGKYQAYPNRDSISYIDIYNLHDAKTVIRATLRNFGWCETLKAMVDLGFLSDDAMDLSGMSYGDLMLKQIGGSGNAREAAMSKLGIAADSTPIKNIEWLGLFSDGEIPLEKGSCVDVFEKIMLEKMSYKPGERDMIVLHHNFVASFPGGGKENITSTLIDFGIPNGDSAMSRTVGLPAAIAARYVLEGKIAETGVHIPALPEIYEPVMEELARLGIHCIEKTESI